MNELRQHGVGDSLGVGALAPSAGPALLASIVISTYNRKDALRHTLERLGRQTVATDRYEILVVDDGSQDGTFAELEKLQLPCALRCFRQPQNRGVSAGRNRALREARGAYVILISDDVLVCDNFVAGHIATHERYPGCWVVGGFRQLESLTETPFGRYLDSLERGFSEQRKAHPLAPDICELGVPTARNLSMPRSDLQQIGLFDEQFTTTCEDQDLAHRAQQLGVRFLLNEAIDCLHNDQAADLARYCRFQQRGASDTYRFCCKYPALHGDAAVARVNGYVAPTDGFLLRAKKISKSLLATRCLFGCITSLTCLAERMGMPDRALFALYRLLIGLAIFRGWREGRASAAHDDEDS